MTGGFAGTDFAFAHHKDGHDNGGGNDNENNGNENNGNGNDNGAPAEEAVEEVNEVQRLSLKEIEAPPTGSFENGAYIKGIVNIKDRLIVLLDVSKFLSDSSEAITDAVTSAPEVETSSADIATPEISTEVATEEVSTPEVAATEETPSDDDVLPEIDAIINESKA